MTEELRLQDWLGRTVIRRFGSNKGRLAEVIGVYKDADKNDLFLLRHSTGRKSYNCRPYNYVLAEELQRELTYTPKAASIEETKRCILEHTFTLEGGSEQYVALSYGWINPVILRHMIDDGYLKRIGRLMVLLERKRLSWGGYCRKEQEKKRGRPYHHNTIVYQILKDITEFSW